MIAPGVDMPWVSLGTCCGSDPRVGVAPWLAAATLQPIAGIDTALDYNDQGAIATELAAASTPRAKVFLTTKIPGAAHLNGDPKIDCPSLDYRACAVHAVKTDLAQLKMAAADLVLLHDPGLANGTAVTAALWQGMQDMLAAGLARSIGVSNFNSMQVCFVTALACAWRVHGACMACAWHLYGTCMARVWHVHGTCTALASHVRNLSMPILTHYGHTYYGSSPSSWLRRRPRSCRRSTRSRWVWVARVRRQRLRRAPGTRSPRRREQA